MGRLNERNPFVSSVYDIKTRNRPAFYMKGESVSMVDDRTGEIKGRGYNAVLQEKLIDTERFVKLYGKGMEVLPKLSSSAVKVLWALIGGMGYDDLVSLNMKKMKDITGYRSDTIIYRAISELKSYDILANAYRNGLYYINPLMFYRGNRLKLLK